MKFTFQFGNMTRIETKIT